MTMSSAAFGLAPSGPTSSPELSGVVLSIVIINTDNRQQTLECLESVLEGTRGITLEVIVVDNASRDDSVAAIREAYPSVTVVENTVRQGFSTNNNLAMARSSGCYLLLLNDDTVVAHGALERMVAFMYAHQEAGAVGAHLLNPDGSDQEDCDLPPHPLYDALRPLSTWLRPFRPDCDQASEVGTVCGACMMVRREVIESVGPLDTDYDPIYSEEVDWCHRIRAAGWKVYRLPDAHVVHYGSQTMNRVPSRRLHLLHSHKAMFYAKQGRRWDAWTFKVALCAFSCCKLIGWVLLFPLGPHTALVKLRAHADVASRALRYRSQP